MADTFARMRQIVGTEAEWAAHNLIIGDGEIAIERDMSGVCRVKVGNGGLAWSSLPYLQGQEDEYVPKSQLTVTGGTPAQSGMVPQLDANGVLSMTILNVPGTIVIKAAVAPTSTAPAAVPGDAYLFTPAGTLDASWVPVGGTAVQAGDMAVKIGTNWSVLATSSDTSNKVSKTGDTMLGPLYLVDAPTGANEASTKAYVDSKSGGYLPLTGGMLTGSLAVTGSGSVIQLQKPE